jgi:hypothetical protein
MIKLRNHHVQQDVGIYHQRQRIQHHVEIPSNYSHKVQGSHITLLFEWENGGITKEPLKIIAADDPVTCAIYARENGLLDQPGWK